MWKWEVCNYLHLLGKYNQVGEPWHFNGMTETKHKRKDTLQGRREREGEGGREEEEKGRGGWGLGGGAGRGGEEEKRWEKYHITSLPYL